jgi:putative holliday junction resolvase
MTNSETDPSADFNGGIPNFGRLAGIDYGSARVGIATCDPSQHYVSPFETYHRRNERLDSQYFKQLSEQEQIVGWVIGWPIHCDGQESLKSKEVHQFAKWLFELTQIPFTFYDERFSSKEARKLMIDTGWSPKQKKSQIDRIAAYVILTHFLEARHQVPSSLD